MSQHGDRDQFARPGHVGGRFAVGSAPDARHRQGVKRPADDAAPDADFLFDVEGEMEMEDATTAFSAYIQPGTGKRRTVVCKHWLRGLCKKGDMCDYLHEYDEDKMPVCQFYFSESVRAATVPLQYLILPRPGICRYTHAPLVSIFSRCDRPVASLTAGLRACLWSLPPGRMQQG